MPETEWVTIQLDMRNARRVQMEARGTAAAIRSMGTASLKAGVEMQESAARGWLFNQMMFTLRRVVYAGTLAIGALGTAATVMGLQFNSTMEQNELAFSTFLGSTRMAKQEMEFLFDLAAKTPFEFPQLTAAARQLMAFGFTLEETNPLLMSLADAMSAMGLGGEAIDRATLALGQMISSGRVLGQDLRQLEQLGLINPEDLARRLNINPADIGNIGALNIPSRAAIDAIMQYWDERFAGASKKFAGTLFGQFTTLHDYVGQLMGTVTQPLSDRLKNDILPRTNILVRAMQQGFRDEGMIGLTKAMDDNLATGNSFQVAWVNIRRILLNAKDAAEELLSIFQDTFRLLGGATPLFLLGTALGIVADALDKLHWILVPLLALWVLDRTRVLLLVTATKSLAFWRGVLATVTGVVAAAETLYIMWLMRAEYWTRLLTKATVIWAGVMTGLRLVAARLAFELLFLSTAFELLFLSSPLGWIILLTVALVVLYFKWKRFHDIVNETFFFMKRNWRWFSFFAQMIIGPFATAITMVRSLYNWIKRLIQLIRHPLRIKFSVTGLGKSLLDLIPGAGLVTKGVKGLGHLVGLAGGGSVTREGWTVVGERGPELRYMPRGAQVVPLGATPLGDFAIETELLEPIILNLDRRILAEEVAKVRVKVHALK